MLHISTEFWYNGNNNRTNAPAMLATSRGVTQEGEVPMCSKSTPNHNSSTTPNLSGSSVIHCDSCGKPFTVYPYRSGKARFCSVACTRTLKERVCRQCGKHEMVRASKSNRPYCSNECYAESMRGKGVGRAFPSVITRRSNDGAYKRGVSRTQHVRTRDVEQMLEYYGNECAYCGSTSRVGLDHVEPLSRGGEHAISNLVPCCAKCNQLKRDRSLPKFLLRVNFGVAEMRRTK